VNKSVRFHEEALAELIAEAVYYESKSKGLGERFAHEIEAAIGIAREFPEIGAPFKYGTRRVFPKRFPFSIVYRVHSDEIIILAVAPDARKPGYWRNRKSEG
jgi:plasmid stabilization system protein ParE